MTFSLLANLNYQLGRMKSLPRVREDLISVRGVLEQNKMMAERKIALVGLSKEFYQKAVDLVYATSVGELEKVLNLALKFVFFDKSYQIRIELDDSRGVKTLEFILLDDVESPPMEVDLKDGTGAGIRTVVSFVIHFFYLVNKGVSPFLFVDEHYSAISSQYRDRFFQFVKQVCQKKEGGLVLITHDMDIMEMADRTYIVADGVVTLRESEK